MLQKKLSSWVFCCLLLAWLNSRMYRWMNGSEVGMCVLSPFDTISGKEASTENENHSGWQNLIRGGNVLVATALAECSLDFELRSKWQVGGWRLVLLVKRRYRRMHRLKSMLQKNCHPECSAVSFLLGSSAECIEGDIDRSLCYKTLEKVLPGSFQ